MYCNKHMLCLRDCPKTFKSLTYNHLEINNFEFLKYICQKPGTWITFCIRLQEDQYCDSLFIFIKEAIVES